MTREELTKYNGKDSPAYVAVSGVIYDVTSSPYWKGGVHEGLHQAGGDLTEELRQAPHVRAVIERFPVVGSLDDGNNGKNSLAPLIAAIALVTLGVLTYLFIR